VSRAAELEQVFLDCFHADYRTRLVGGAAEPLYMPARDGQDARIYYREDFAASALHEVAHWCIAGTRRRAREDYGYWYAPDGRSVAQQRAFERVEVRPQALEWHLALASDVHFHVSADNLLAPDCGGGEFAAAVVAQARCFCSEPLPPRGALFRDALARYFDRDPNPGPAQFRLPEVAA
jgi:elongation factor P hydroxylase